MRNNMDKSAPKEPLSASNRRLIGAKAKPNVFSPVARDLRLNKYASPKKHESQTLANIQRAAKNFEDSPRPQLPPTLPNNKSKGSVYS